MFPGHQIIQILCVSLFVCNKIVYYLEYDEIIVWEKTAIFVVITLKALSKLKLNFILWITLNDFY